MRHLIVLLTLSGCVAPRGSASHDLATGPKSSTGQQLAEVFAGAACQECHSAQGAASESRLIFLRRGAAPQEIEEAITSFRELVQGPDPTQARLFRKPTKRMLHEGGEKIAPGSPEEKILLAWLRDLGKAPRDAQALREILVASGPELAWPVRYQGRPSLLRRLSRDEMVATVDQLIGAKLPRADLPEEPRSGHGPLVTVGVSLLANEIRALQVVMNDFALKVAPQVLTRSGCAAIGQAQRDCLGAWARGLVTQAFRRAPLSDETALLRGMFAEVGQSTLGDVAAVEAVLSSVFLSPSFLYREEIGTPVVGRPGLRALRGDEIASRLSFLSTQTPPDAQLLAAAKGGRLSDPAERIRHFDRLVASDRGRKAQAVFVLEWLGANEAKIKLKSKKYKKDLKDDFEQSVRDSAEGAIKKLLSEREGATVAGLLSTKTYVNDDVMKALNDHEGDDRMGLMMHPQVLAAHTKESGASPFQIGAFMREALLCEAVPPPPVDAAASARTDEPKGLSVRESLEYRTSVGRVCSGCHQGFAPMGYSFLPFDPVGRRIDQDPSGKPWDLAGSIPTSSGVPIRFQTPSDLMRGLAHHPQVHGCFAQAALQWTLGRGLVPADQPLVVVLNEVATRTHGNLPAIFRAIVSAPDFVNVVAPKVNTP